MPTPSRSTIITVKTKEMIFWNFTMNLEKSNFFSSVALDSGIRGRYCRFSIGGRGATADRVNPSKYDSMLTYQLFCKLSQNSFRNVTVQDVRWETKCQTFNTSRPECTTNWETRDRTVVRQECDQVIETVCTNYTVPVYEVVSLKVCASAKAQLLAQKMYSLTTRSSFF